MKRTLIIIFSLLTLASCTPTKIASSDGSVPNKSAGFLLKKLKKSALEYDWFSSRAKIKYISMDQNRSVRANIRIRKDSMIWMSVTLFGIEGARIKITPDSVHVLNRIEKQYIVAPLSYVEENLGLPADYSSVESMLVGSPVLLDGNDYEVSVKDNQYQLKTEQPLKTTYLLDRDFQYTGFIVQDNKRQKMDMAFKEYEELEGRNFSFVRDALVTSPTRGNASVEMEFSKVQFDTPKKMSFKVPSSYKVMRN
jgi:hypothetical protein